MKRLSLLALLSVFAVVGAARAEDEAPATSRWMLTMEHGPLKIVSVKDATGRATTYHYMTIKVTNPTKLKRDWYPRVRAITDTKRTSVAMGYDEALPAVKKEEGDDSLVAIGTTIGKIAPGQVLNTVAIFGPLDPLYDEVHVQVIGLADPIAIYKVERFDVEVDVPGVTYTQVDPKTNEASKVTQALTIQDVAYTKRNRAVKAAMTKELGNDADVPKPSAEYWEVREYRAFEMVFYRPGDEFRPDDDLITAGPEFWNVVGDVRLERQIQM